MAHSLTGTGIIGGIAIFVGAKAMRRFKTFDLHLSWGNRLVCSLTKDACVVMSVRNNCNDL